MADIAAPSAGQRDRLVAWLLGTFHAAALIIILLVVLYLSGGLASTLTGLNTASGLALFIALWFTTTWSTHRAVRGLLGKGLQVALPASGLITRAATGGAMNGVAFLLLLLVILGVPAILAGGGLPLLVVGLLPAIIALVFAIALGTLVGLAFAAVDAALLSVARALLR